MPGRKEKRAYQFLFVFCDFIPFSICEKKKVLYGTKGKQDDHRQSESG